MKEWTSLSFGSIIFDTTFHNWSKYSSELNTKVLGKKQLLFIIEEEDIGEKFGFYLHSEISWNFHTMKPHQKSFHFNFNNCDNLLKFEIRKLKYEYILFPNESDELIQIGDIILYKKHKYDQCECISIHWNNFYYHDIKRTLCTSIGYGNFNLKRLLIIEMK